VFGSAANNGQMILDAAGKSRAADAFQVLAQIVSRREMPALAAAKRAKGGGKSLPGGLFKKKAR
jgi:pilus assembly protein CpaE